MGAGGFYWEALGAKVALNLGRGCLACLLCWLQDVQHPIPHPQEEKPLGHLTSHLP